MQYTVFGKSGISVSKLGFGCMRLPEVTIDGKKDFDVDKSVEMMHYAIEQGVNYFDTAPYYCDKKSESIVGKGLKGLRDKVYLSTKYPVGDGMTVQESLDKSLKNLDTDHIDFFHLWGINLKSFNDEIQIPGGSYEQALKLRDEGVIRNLSFSFHDAPENMIEIIKRGEGNFASVLCQYNLLDRANEESIAYAHEQNMGVTIMGPVGGGRLGYPSPAIAALLPGKVTSSPELALRFVMSNPNVNIALSGMGSMAMVEENCAVASNSAPLTDEELAGIAQSLDENKRLMELYCTGCNYCMPCPAGLNIPELFRMMNYHRVYKLTEYAKEQYASIGDQWHQFKNAAACVGCGQCEKKCPQHLSIREQLKDVHKTLSK